MDKTEKEDEMSIKNITINEVEFIDATKVAVDLFTELINANTDRLELLEKNLHAVIGADKAIALVISIYVATLATVLFDGNSDEALEELKERSDRIEKTNRGSHDN